MYRAALEELEKATDEILSKAKKSEDIKPKDIADGSEDDSEEETDGGAESEADDADDDEEAKKALGTESLDEDYGVSDTTAAMIEVIAKSLADVLEDVNGSRETTEESAEALAKSLVAHSRIMQVQQGALEKANSKLTKLAKSFAERMDAIDQKLDALGAQPAGGRKSVASYAVADRNFQGSLQGNGPEHRQLSKAQILGVLQNEYLNGSAMVTPEDIIGVESGAEMRNEIRTLVESKSAL